ncbi:HAD family hydrolase [Paenibacillus nasutitermitis]|uniref:Haloacid dehalogenase n=1 Tax=Paenibacillus nasutitermitis TaxID=1652958 RepID=A0A916YPN4_9BACL|nr:HAD family hydrolase [Paenibacillus nasutitermitis]GGD55802.1 haloacid dehalogenase [Paenibacillus nasutitermitis]
MNNDLNIRSTVEQLGLKAVIFDLDNTLLNRTATFRRFSEKLMDHYFPDLSPADREIRIEFIRTADQDGYKNKPVLFAELAAHELFPWNPAPQSQELLAFYEREYVNSSVLMESAVELLTHCRRNYKLGLITNGQTRIQYGKMDLLAIRDHFDHISVSEEAGVKKPDRRIYELSLSKLGVRPEEAVYIGDHPVNDIEGAAAAGMHTLWMRQNQPWAEHITAKPLASVGTLRELIDIF